MCLWAPGWELACLLGSGYDLHFREAQALSLQRTQRVRGFSPRTFPKPIRGHVGQGHHSTKGFVLFFEAHEDSSGAFISYSHSYKCRTHIRSLESYSWEHLGEQLLEAENPKASWSSPILHIPLSRALNFYDLVYPGRISGGTGQGALEWGCFLDELLRLHVT